MLVASLFGLTPRSVLTVAPLGEAWHDFYLMAGTAAVTLVGLLFVALSLHVAILFQSEHRDFRMLAAEAFQGYLYVLITSLLFLLPVGDSHFTTLVYALLNLIMLGRTALRAPSFFAAHKAKGGATNQRWRFFVPGDGVPARAARGLPDLGGPGERRLRAVRPGGDDAGGLDADLVGPAGVHRPCPG